MFSFFWEFIIIVFETLLYFILMNKKLLLKDGKNQILYVKQAFFLIIFCIILLILNACDISTIYTVSIGFVVHFIFVLLFFSDNLLTKLLWTILYTTFAIISDFITTAIPIFYLNISTQDILNYGSITRIIFTMLYILILSLLTIISLSFDTKTFVLSRCERFVFTIISITCIIIEQLLLISIINEYNNSTKINVNLQLSIFVLVFCFFFTLIFYIYQLGITREKNEQLIEENLMAKINEIQFEHITNSITELKGLKHDINNHLITLSALINNNELLEASNYLNNIMDNVKQNRKLVSTGSTYIDCIISNKLLYAEKNNISVEYIIHLPSKIPLSNIDICSLLGNLLDNAIECCCKVLSPVKRFLHIYIKPFNNMLSITIENSSNGIYNTNTKGEFISTKQEDSNFRLHGFGIKQINKITKKYGGIVRFTPAINTFTADILIPLNIPQ